MNRTILRPQGIVIGDWLMAEGRVVRVAAVHQRKIGYHVRHDKLAWARLDRLEYIRITPETLRAFGFVRKEEWDGFLDDDNAWEFTADGLSFDEGSPFALSWREVVAVGQRYKDVIREANRDESVWQFLVEKDLMQSGGAIDTRLCTHAGYGNKMFTRADFMPWQVQMTDLWFEHLQDISDEDCLKEGVTRKESPLDGGWNYYVKGLPPKRKRNGSVTDFAVSADGTAAIFGTPRGAFAALIDRINGRGTWQDNPWVVAYTMDLQRAEGFKEQETNK